MAQRYQLGPIGKFAVYTGKRLTEASSYSGLAFLVYTLWPRGIYIAAACAVAAVLLAERK